MGNRRSRLVRVSRRRGVVRIGFDAVEIGLLHSLFDDLGDALATMTDDDPVRRRLFPAGYRDDVDASAEFRDLTESGLLDQRVSRIDQVRADLPSTAGDVVLDPDGALRWLAVLNDLRLAIGTRLDIGGQEESGSGGDSSRFEPDPDQTTRAVYLWLTALQDRLVETVMD